MSHFYVVLSVIMLSDIYMVLSVTMLSMSMLSSVVFFIVVVSVIMPSAVLLSVEAPKMIAVQALFGLPGQNMFAVIRCKNKKL